MQYSDHTAVYVPATEEQIIPTSSRIRFCRPPSQTTIAVHKGVLTSVLEAKTHHWIIRQPARLENTSQKIIGNKRAFRDCISKRIGNGLLYRHFKWKASRWGSRPTNLAAPQIRDTALIVQRMYKCIKDFLGVDPKAQLGRALSVFRYNVQEHAIEVVR